MGIEGQVTCAICKTRRARRYCPGITAHICPICCGTERENTIACPFDCAYLREARAREKEPQVDPKNLLYSEIAIDEAFLSRNEPLLIYVASLLAQAAVRTEGAIDNDLLEALDGLVRTYKALQSGLVYDVRPENPIAARLYSNVRDAIQELEQKMQKENATLRDSDLLGVFVFLLRLTSSRNNQRRKGRAAIDFLREFLPPESQPEPQSSLILP